MMRIALDEINECMVEELALLKSSQYVFWGSYRQCDSNWECMLYDGKYLTDDQFLSHFHMDRSCAMQLNRLVEDDQDWEKNMQFRSIVSRLASGQASSNDGTSGGWAVLMTTASGQIVRSVWAKISILIRRSICLGIWPFQLQQ